MPDSPAADDLAHPGAHRRAHRAPGGSPGGRPALGDNAAALSERPTARPAGPGAPAAPGGPAAAALSLPRLAGVPDALTLAERAGLCDRIAWRLLEAGWLAPRHLDADGEIARTLEACLLDGLTGGCAPRYFGLRLEIANTREAPDPFDTRAEHGTDLQIAVYLDQVEEAVVGRRLTRLCRGQNRAAALALGIIEAAADTSFPLFSPTVGRFILESRHWMGMENQRGARLEMLAMGEDPRDYDIISEQAAFAQMPRWTTEIPGAGDRHHARARRLAAQLETWRGRLDPLLEARLDALLAGMLTVDTPGWMDPATGEADEIHDDSGPVFSGILRWSHDDPLPRLFDDWADDAQQTGSIGLILRRQIPTDDPARTRADLDALAGVFALSRAVDRTLALIDERGWP